MPESDIASGPLPSPPAVLARTTVPAKRVGFLLIPGFALMSYAAAIEPLRAANQLSGRALYDWAHLTPDGQPAAASNGVAVAADRRLDADASLDLLLVCAGGNPALFDDPKTLQHLRRLARRGVEIGGISGGPFVLARAGLLDGVRCTIHWEHQAAFREAFPLLDTRSTLFEIDRGRLTSAGGVGALDLIAALIERDHGQALAAAVRDWFLQPQARPGGDPQRASLQARTGIANAAVLAGLAAMERSIEHPVPRAALATAAGVSLRQLERLFWRHLGETIGARYRATRLDRARTLVRETGLPVAEIALACGFPSPAHFSRAYRARFGRTPSGERLMRRSARDSV